MSNYESLKKWRERNRKECPGDCGSTVAWDTILCRKCTGRRRTQEALSQTIAEIKLTKKARWTHHIRSFSGKIKFDNCLVCGYELHVETCHVKSISSFPDSATIKEINDVSNLVGLCPTHHWEFDNGLLVLPA